jgi:AraC-like DNA-binding protein
MSDDEHRGLFDCGTWAVSPHTEFGPYTWEDGAHSMFWILDGSAVVLAEGRRTELTPNSIYCAPPDIPHFITWDPVRRTRFGWANFFPADPAGLPRVRHLAADDIVLALLRHILAIRKDRPEGWQESSRLAFDYLIHAFRSGNSEGGVGVESVAAELVVLTVAAMQRRWHYHPLVTPTLDELAAELGVGRRQLCRAFDAEVGVGPITMLRMARVLGAARLLTESNRSIREIAELVGFSDPYHFARVFKATIGVPPGEYRSHPLQRVPIPPRVAQLASYIVQSPGSPAPVLGDR